MNNWKVLFISLIAIISASTATADQYTDSGLYLSGGVGQNWIQSGIPEEETTVLQFAVGWQFTPNVSVEVGYKDFGKFPGPTLAYTDFDITGASAAVVGHLPISSNIALFAKVGQVWWSADSSFFFFNRNGGANQSGTLNFSEEDALFGLGLSFELTNQIEMDIEYNQYEFGFPNNPNFNNDNSALVVSFRYEL